MSKLTDLLKFKIDSTEITSQQERDKRLDNITKEIKSLFKEIVESSRVPIKVGDMTIVDIVNVCPTKVLLEKVDEL